MFHVVYIERDFLGNYVREHDDCYDSMSPVKYYAELQGPGTRVYHNNKLFCEVGDDGHLHLV